MSLPYRERTFACAKYRSSFAGIFSKSNSSFFFPARERPVVRLKSQSKRCRLSRKTQWIYVANFPSLRARVCQFFNVSRSFFLHVPAATLGVFPCRRIIRGAPSSSTARVVIDDNRLRLAYSVRSPTIHLTCAVKRSRRGNAVSRRLNGMCETWTRRISMSLAESPGSVDQYYREFYFLVALLAKFKQSFFIWFSLFPYITLPHLLVN